MDSKKKWALENKEKVKESQKKWRENNKEKITQKKKEYRENNKEKIKKSSKEYNDKNKEKNHQYYILNKEKIIKYQRDYKKNKKKIDPLFKLKNDFSKLLLMSFKRKGYTKKSKTHEILGCSFEEFKLHLESQFEPWMNWKNRGLYNGELNHGWDIDHTIPQSTSMTEEEFIKLNHYTNLKPLCSKINRDIKKNNYGVEECMTEAEGIVEYYQKPKQLKLDLV
jgi:hypothetical protein